MSFVQVTEKCWIWQGHTNDQGYGRFGVGDKVEQAHRVSYTIFKGPIPEGMNVLHECDTPPCVKPSCLFLGTQIDNMGDASSKQRLNNPFGEKHPQCKLLDQDIKELRQLRLQGWTYKQLAEKYKIHKDYAAKLCKNKHR